MTVLPTAFMFYVYAVNLKDCFLRIYGVADYN